MVDPWVLKEKPRKDNYHDPEEEYDGEDGLESADGGRHELAQGDRAAGAARGT